MKSLGIVRKVDELGRIVLPIETRRALGLNAGDGAEIFTEGNTIILRKHETSCIFCGSTDDIIEYSGKKICKSCAEKLNSLTK